ncbi:hypothetical protein S83_056856 [Arachis hypogaea]
MAPIYSSVRKKLNSFRCKMKRNEAPISTRLKLHSRERERECVCVCVLLSYEVRFEAVCSTVVSSFFVVSANLSSSEVSIGSSHYYSHRLVATTHSIHVAIVIPHFDFRSAWFEFCNWVLCSPSVR